MNPHCVAYTEPIEINRGFGKIDPLKDVKEGRLKCPGCGQLFELQRVTLYQAEMVVESHLHNAFETETETYLALRSQMVKLGNSEWCFKGLREVPRSETPGNDNMRAAPAAVPAGTSASKGSSYADRYLALKFDVR